MAVESAIFGAIGTVVSLIGDDKEEDAEKARVRAENRANKARTANTKKQNKNNKKIADNKTKTAKQTAKAYEDYAKDYNEYVQTQTAKMNELEEKYVAAQNKAVDAKDDRVQAEYEQSRMDNIRERRQYIRQAVMAMSATTAAAANKGALGGSGYRAGKADLGTQLSRGMAASFINLGVLDTLRHADRLYADAMTEANVYKSQQSSLKNETDATLTTMSNTYNVEKTNIEAGGVSRENEYVKANYDLQDDAAAIETRRNRATGAAKSKAMEGNAISSIGSAVSSLGASIFG